MLEAADIERVVVALLAESLAAERKRATDPAEWSAWGAETRIDEDGVGADSLTRLDAVARVNTFFHLHEVGTEDYLVVRRTLGEWVDVVRQTLAMRSERITFATSGSTGAPKKIAHPLARLDAEAAAFAELLTENGDKPVRRVLAFTPPQHIFGFIFTVLLPRHLGAPVEDARLAAPSRLRRADPGDLVVATPFLWSKLLENCPKPPQGVRGVSSGAPTTAAIWRAAAKQGLERLVEVYGSSETAGVGWREQGDAPFRLLERWSRGAQDGTLIQNGDDVTAAPDSLIWRDDRSFTPTGRRDSAVQIGGVNVFPHKVRETLLSHDLVADCAVRVDGAADARLKAFVVLSQPLDEGAAMQALNRHCAGALAAPERPASFAFGPDLPRNAMGKLADWG